jgi:hypothetical protein
MRTSCQAATKVNVEVAPKVRSPEGRAFNRRAKAAWITENWLKQLFHFSGVITAAWQQGHIEQLEKPSLSRREITGAGKSYNQKHWEMD